MTPLVEAMALVIAELENQRIDVDLAASETIRRLGELLQEGRSTADAEIARFREGIAQTEARTINRIASSIAKAADAALGRRVSAVDRRAAVMVAFALILTSGVCFWAGLEWGARSAEVMIATTEGGLRTAFKDGPEAAALWLDLMTWNDPRAALFTCASPGNSFIQAGRRACRVPLWTQRPVTLSGS